MRAGHRISPVLRSCTLQSFLAVYNVLRDELLEEESLGKQPPNAVEWVREVRALTSKSRTARLSSAQRSASSTSPPIPGPRFGCRCLTTTFPAAS